MEEELDGFQVPVCQGLVKPITILGVSREAMILNVATAAIFVLSLRLYYLFWVFFITHYLLFRACKKDPEVINIFLKKYIRQLDYYEEG